MKEYQKHQLEPIYDQDSEILILGSFPSPKSREVGFYYGHPCNRFWPIMEALFNVSLKNKEDKIQFLLDHHIALWDVIASCKIDGAKDSSITNVKPNDISKLIKQTKIKYIFTTGKKAYQLYQKYIQKEVDFPVISLPSTSPLNAQMSLDHLITIYQNELLTKMR